MPYSRQLGLVAIVMAVAMVAGCAGDPLYSDLSEHQANEVMAALVAAQLNANKRPSRTVRDAWAVHVPAAQIPQAMAVLRARGLPRHDFASLGLVFRKEGFATSQLEEKARYLHAINQELADTLSRLDGVVDARVHVALPDRDPLGGTVRDASAAVVILHRPGQSLEDREIDIKAIVMDGVEGLDDINKVTVKFFPGPAEPLPASPPSAYAAAWRQPLTAVLAGLLLLALGWLGWSMRETFRLRRRAGGSGRAE